MYVYVYILKEDLIVTSEWRRYPISPIEAERGIV